MPSGRYNSVAISLHWLIALLLAVLIIMAKVMNSLADDDSFRFTLIQWHKSLGILALFLVLCRILWRITHRPPRLPPGMRVWERRAADASHFLFYVLMLVIPISGWMMVSSSPLNLKTVLFGLIDWPHIPYLTNLTDKELWSERFVMAHHWLGNGLLLLVILHVAAALRHQFILKDNLLSRMVIANEHNSRGDLNHGLVFGAIIGLAGVLFLVEQARYTGAENTAATPATDISVVGFEASQLGDAISGVFEEAKIELILDSENPPLSSLVATVVTASVNTGDGQIDGTVVTEDWFASEQYPVARFKSTAFYVVDSGYQVLGNLNIRDVVKEVSIDMTVSGRTASGRLQIDRTEFNVGVGGQDEFVAPEVSISFQTPVILP